MAMYSDGITQSEVGDKVRCIHNGLYHVAMNQESFVTEISGENIKVNAGFGTLYSAHHFRLVSRAPSPAKSEPLVKWPEERLALTWNDLPDQSLFVWVKCPDMPCLRDGSRWFVVANHEKANKLLFCGSDEVRRIQFNPANKEPVFVVV